MRTTVSVVTGGRVIGQAAIGDAASSGRAIGSLPFMTARWGGSKRYDDATPGSHQRRTPLASTDPGRINGTAPGTPERYVRPRLYTESTPAADALADDIRRVVAAAKIGEPGAVKRGRDARWRYVPVIVSGDGRTQNPVRGRAYATREEAVEAARRHIEAWRDDLAKRLADPRQRALRASYGLPRDVTDDATFPLGLHEAGPDAPNVTRTPGVDPEDLIRATRHERVGQLGPKTGPLNRPTWVAPVGIPGHRTTPYGSKLDTFVARGPGNGPEAGVAPQPLTGWPADDVSGWPTTQPVDDPSGRFVASPPGAGAFAGIIEEPNDVSQDAAFNPEDHPRGQPENAGEFAPHAGGRTPVPGEATKPGTAEHAAAHATAEVPNVPSGMNDAPPDRASWPEHIKKLRIPPAWTNVRIARDPAAPLQAVGTDSKGRRQYVYSAEAAATNAAAKFARIKELDAKFGEIYEQNAANQRSADQRTRALADCTALVMSTGIRPGSDEDTRADQKAYGASTLQGRHVVEVDGEVRLRFVGKKGVHLDLPVSDPKIARMLLERAQEAGPVGRLFGDAVNHASLLSYTHSLDGGSFKTKDFRTCLGTREARSIMVDLPRPTDKKSFRQAVMTVAKHVSKKLGNTPAIALSSYIAPEVFTPWQEANA